MSNTKMKVLTISVDVSELSESQIEDLQTAMEVQTEDTDTPILNSSVNEMDIDELMEEDSGGLH
jgi:ribosomal protein L12E/L44/L45/RPP1/RPP2